MNEQIKRLGNIGIVPVVKINKQEDTLPTAKALLNGGIDCMEVTFRSEHTIYAIEKITKEYPEIFVGAGTVSSVKQAQDAVAAGAEFIVTPGLNIPVIEWCKENDVIIVPGIGTPSEIEIALSYGISDVKLFPAATMGGDKFIKDVSGPYPELRIMPTGGINAKNMHDYLKLSNVIAIGGSFMLPNDLISEGKWDELEALSKNAVKALLDLKVVEIVQPEATDASISSWIAETTLSHGPKQTIVLDTPYLDRVAYHLGKDNKVVNNNGVLTIEQENHKIIIKERD